MLTQLISDLIREGKMSADEAINRLCRRLDDEDRRELYRELYEMGYGHKLNERAAKQWVKSMAVTDGSDSQTGEHWSESETYAVGQKMGIDWSKVSRWDWYAVLNMMYSDYYRSAEVFGMADKMEFFAQLAKDFVSDADSDSGKVYRYYISVV